MYMSLIIGGLGILAPRDDLVRRQSDSNDIRYAPEACGPVYDRLKELADAGVLEYSDICDENTPFQTAVENVKECKDTYSNVTGGLSIYYPAIQTTLDLCANVDFVWCAEYGYSHTSYPANCSTLLFPANSTSITSDATFISTTSDDSTVSRSTTSQGLVTPTSSIAATEDTNSSSTPNVGAIAGGAVGGAAFLGSILGVFLFIRRHRRKKQKAKVHDEPHEKAQLHGDDIKPDRKELTGSKVPQAMLEKQTALNELPANEEVRRHDESPEEMPSNETPGHEMETTENEMRALDRLTGTTQVSST